MKRLSSATILAMLALTAGAAHAQDPPTGGATRAFDPGYGAGEAEVLPTPAGDVIYVEKGAGEPVVFFMPTFDYRYWQLQLDEIAQEHRAVAFSFSFEGQAAAPPGPPPPAAGDLPGPLFAGLIPALEALQREFAMGPVHLVTHSISGRAGLEVAAVRPDLFATLTLLEPAGGVAAPDAQPAPAACRLEGLTAVERQLCLFINTMSGPGYYEALSAPVRQYLLETETMVVEGRDSSAEIDPALLFPPICEEIGEISIPVLFVRGANTPAAVQSGLDHYEACLPPHETVVVEGVTHNAHFDAPDAFNAAVLSFIADHSM